jgi:transcription elongation GreA/GreB family factor
MTLEEIKHILYQKCLAWIENKIEISTKAMNDAQDSANSEEKSSAGDKYETGRAMSQNERDMYARQLAECLKQKQLLLSINPDQSSSIIVAGSLVRTEAANYFISISAGSFSIDNVTYFAVSIDTPVAKLLLGKKAGDSFVLNGKSILIRENH